MDLTAIAEALQASGFSEWMRGSLRALPIIESIHVMAVAVVFGTVLLVDLRLLGIGDTNRPFTRLASELFPWTWVGFGAAVVTGTLMFVPNATTYVSNTAFGLKLTSLVAAGLNMAVFQFTTYRSVASWDRNARVPVGGRVAGALSIAIWICVIVFGRWIGFTKGYDFSIPENMEFDFLGSCLRCLSQLAFG